MTHPKTKPMTVEQALYGIYNGRNRADINDFEKAVRAEERASASKRLMELAGGWRKNSLAGINERVTDWNKGFDAGHMTCCNQVEHLAAELEKQ